MKYIAILGILDYKLVAIYCQVCWELLHRETLYYFKHNRARCVAALLERLGTESGVFLPLNNFFGAGNPAQDALVNAGG